MLKSWLDADMREISLNRKFQGVIAWDSFFHLSPEDQRLMFVIFQEQAAPGAALIFTSGTKHGEAIGSFEGEPLYHASLESKDYHELLKTHGFEVVSHVGGDEI